MRSPLTAWLLSPDTTRAIDLREEPEFGRSWQGGYTEATVRLLERLDSADPLLQPMTRLRIDDGRNANTVWEGYLDLPGQSRGDDGDVWQIGAVGPSARGEDQQRPYILFDSLLGSWRMSFATNGNMTAQQGALPSNESVDALVLTFPQGIPIGNASRVAMIYGGLVRSGQKIGKIFYRHREGLNSTDNKVELWAETYEGTEDLARQHNMSTAFNEAGTQVGGDFTNGRNRPKLRLHKVSGGATNVGGDNHWTGVTQLEVQARRKNILGADIVGAGSYPNNYVLAHEAVIDALWWFDPTVDIPSAVIDTTFAYQIDQLAYEDPVTFQELLDDLALLEPDMLWEFLAATPSGDHQFNLRRLSSEVRYQASTRDGWDSPGAESTLRNAITIVWEDKDGKTFARTFTAADFGLDVPGLDQWGITRDADSVELSTELGSENNAERIAERLMTQGAMPPASGTLSVAGPIEDLWYGRSVWPWEIEPGYLLNITDLALDPMPITELAYREGVAALTVGEPVLTTDQLINRMTRRRRNR